MNARGNSLHWSIGVFSALLLSAAAVAADSALAQSPAASDEHRLTLRAIMQELGEEYERLSKALLNDDFNGLANSAKAIQGHPLPAELVASIKNRLGKSFRDFNRIDEGTHRAAADLTKRAAAKDLSGSAQAYARLAQGCVACHKQFRAELHPLSD